MGVTIPVNSKIDFFITQSTLEDRVRSDTSKMICREFTKNTNRKISFMQQRLLPQTKLIQQRHVCIVQVAVSDQRKTHALQQQ